MSLSPELLSALRDKYLELEALRRERAESGEEAPRARLGALAARFPGALRELDQLPMPVIEARLASLSRALEGPAHTPPWVAVQLAYHGWMRALLRLKQQRPEGPPRAVLAALRGAYRQEVAYEPGPDRLDLEVAAALIAPPGGRLSRWAVARVAGELGLEPAEVEAALFDFRE